MDRWKLAFWGLLAIAITALVGAGIWMSVPGYWDTGMFRWTVAVALFGAAVGASELIARYRDDPLRSLTSWAAALYILVNLAAAAFAYKLIRDFGWTFGATDSQTPWVQAFVAGFGAMMFFRSSLFHAKVGDSNLAIGPGIVFQIFLNATDRSCDRRRGELRAELVKRLMRGVSFSKARVALPSLCFGMMQNVGAEEQMQFWQTVDALASKDMKDDFKTFNLGLMLLNLVGEKALESAVQTAGVRIQDPASLSLDIFVALQDLKFDRAFPLLVDICFNLSCFGTSDQQKEAKAIVISEISPLRERADLDDGAKMTILALSLQQHVGDAVLRTALAYIGDAVSTEAGAGQTEHSAVSQTGPVPTAADSVQTSQASEAAVQDDTKVVKLRGDSDPTSLAGDGPP